MCGFFVEFRKKDTHFNLDSFKKSANLISHRGPDDQNFVHLKNISLQFFRLSIRDLSENGAQPMWDYNKRYLIVFNGEIYNTEYLKKLIDVKKMSGTSDTEILINLFSKHGLKIFDLIDGMFAFIIYDKLNNKCIVGRDRFGIKPLYFFNNEKKIVFSSEIKPLANYLNNSEVSKKTFKEFFLKGYMDHNCDTFFKDINSLEPAHLLIADSIKIVKRKYWNIQNGIENKKNQKTKLSEINVLINKSVHNHLISDREIGIFMSGGTDSASISQIVRRKLKYKIKTFTYDFENNETFSEVKKAKEISKNLNMINHSVVIKPKDIIKNMEKLCKKLESPFTSIRLFGVDSIYKAASENKIKVILEGHGGDEMFGGYKYNYFPFLLDKVKGKLNNIRKIKSKELENKLFVLNNQGLATTDGSPYFNKMIFSKDFLKDLEIKKGITLKKYNKNLNFLKTSQLSDIQSIKIPRILKYTDRISMSYGIETRVPFLDHSLFFYAFHLKNSDKFKNNTSRFLFKKVFDREKIRKFYTKNKKTIVDPQTQWMKKELKEYAYDNFNSSILKNCDYFNQKNIIKLYEDFLKNKINSSFLLFNILTTVNFLKVFKNKF